jgi:ABC-type transporter Mla subunit MlaD
MSRKRRTIALACLAGAIGLAAAGFAFIGGGGGHSAMTVTAKFEDAVGLYTGNQV